ncbi:MAG: peroxide stress protein YaaA [Myxococcota bacterium]|nr:peroxide stress protein YaaA [Myxococcota bacterium]
MLFLLSPAKSLDWSPAPVTVPPTAPDLLDDAGLLMRRAKRLSVDELRALMGISESLATLNRERFQTISPEPDPEADRPAALAFNGDVYRGLDARSLDDESLAWAQAHVGILSGLYGLLRPMDLIQPYRLEMGTRLDTSRGDSLYAFWDDRVTQVVNQRLQGEGDPVVVNLASNEYFRVVKKKALAARVVTPVFKEELPDGRVKVISFFAKWARGAMVRWAIERKVEHVDELLGFDSGGYRHRPDLTEGDTWVFTRPKPAPANG